MRPQVLPMAPVVGEEAGGRCVGEEDAQRELELLQSCDSSHVLRCTASVRHADRLWIVTELCEGGSLLDVMLAQRAPLSEVQVAAACGGALEGLKHLHARKMLHRDVKAGNLLLTAEGAVKLGDLGISVQNKTTLARRMTVIGTPHWLAPEGIAPLTLTLTLTLALALALALSLSLTLTLTR